MFPLADEQQKIQYTQSRILLNCKNEFDLVLVAKKENQEDNMINEIFYTHREVFHDMSWIQNQKISEIQMQQRIKL